MVGHDCQFSESPGASGLMCGPLVRRLNPAQAGWRRRFGFFGAMVCEGPDGDPKRRRRCALPPHSTGA